MENLDSFVKSSRPNPQPVAISQEVRDRGSIFVGAIYRANTPEQATKAVSYLKHVVHAKKHASHEISAWRCMVLKAGKSGLHGTEDFEVKSGNDDDGEKYASGKILKVMQTEGVIDAVVIVSRWYGGEMLYSARFEHIETCAREVCVTFRKREEVEEAISSLLSLDDILASLRAELSQLLKPESEPPQLSQDSVLSSSQSDSRASRKSQDYKALRESLDLAKAKRLVTARENSIKSVKTSLKKAKEKNADPPIVEEGPASIEVDTVSQLLPTQTD
ncbi:ribosomal protein S5 domain 2-like protein [Abortiporus biennis]|nr:ribosomal protein S5 domain 2-like protein [Abortiporus biennis]